MTNPANEANLMPENELKMCPFCGSDLNLSHTDGTYGGGHDGKHLYQVECSSCEFALYEFLSAKDAISFMNTRPGEDTARQEQFERDCKVVEGLVLIDTGKYPPGHV